MMSFQDAPMNTFRMSKETRFVLLKLLHDVKLKVQHDKTLLHRTIFSEYNTLEIIVLPTMITILTTSSMTTTMLGYDNVHIHDGCYLCSLFVVVGVCVVRGSKRHYYCRWMTAI